MSAKVVATYTTTNPVSGGAAATSVSVTVPGGATSHMLLAAVFTYGSSTGSTIVLTPPAGWTEITAADNTYANVGGSNSALWIGYIKRSSSSQTYTWTTSNTAASLCAGVVVIDGADPNNFVDVASNTSANTNTPYTISIPSATSARTGDFVIIATGGTADGGTPTYPSGFTSQFNIGTHDSTVGDLAGLSMASANGATTSTAISGETVTWSGGNWSGFSGYFGAQIVINALPFAPTNLDVTLSPLRRADGWSYVAPTRFVPQPPGEFFVDRQYEKGRYNSEGFSVVSGVSIAGPSPIFPPQLHEVRVQGRYHARGTFYAGAAGVGPSVVSSYQPPPLDVSYEKRQYNADGWFCALGKITVGPTKSSLWIPPFLDAPNQVRYNPEGFSSASGVSIVGPSPQQRNAVPGLDTSQARRYHAEGWAYTSGVFIAGPTPIAYPVVLDVGQAARYHPSNWSADNGTSITGPAPTTVVTLFPPLAEPNKPRYHLRGTFYAGAAAAFPAGQFPWFSPEQPVVNARRYNAEAFSAPLGKITVGPSPQSVSIVPPLDWEYFARYNGRGRYHSFHFDAPLGKVTVGPAPLLSIANNITHVPFFRPF